MGHVGVTNCIAQSVVIWVDTAVNGEARVHHVNLDCHWKGVLRSRVCVD